MYSKQLVTIFNGEMMDDQNILKTLAIGKENEMELEKQRIEMEQFERDSPQLRFGLKGSNREEEKDEIELKEERDMSYRNF